MSKPVVLVVEDEPGIADTIHYALASDGFEPLGCASGAEAIVQFSARGPALAILDVGLPDMNGFELFRRLQELPGGRDVPMVFLTARSSEIDRVVGLELGADDYIAKPFSPRELVARVRTILRRSARGQALGHEEKAAPALVHPAPSAINREALLQGSLVLDEERRLIRYHGHPLELSRYEYGLLATLMQRPGRVFTRDELLERVWDDPGESFDRTVDAHIKTLRAKLRAVREDEDPIRTLRGVGYALKD
ncbi:two-component system response regulator CreB [Ottowia testudinis]|uniref:Two-component system response regulator CreB n=1 Tax=Ottowia testudinis TaxID=2816950 RepID=A0A975CGQ4_9BURK|nr:two-component system response regulator CreB [Ottowia testudinis]QTD45471.1 two-component system response regulator CreB [Ottowia testudinis]